MGFNIDDILEREKPIIGRAPTLIEEGMLKHGEIVNFDEIPLNRIFVNGDSPLKELFIFVSYNGIKKEALIIRYPWIKFIPIRRTNNRYVLLTDDKYCKDTFGTHLHPPFLRIQIRTNLYETIELK